MEFLKDFLNYLWLVTKIMILLIVIVSIFQTIINKIKNKKNEEELKNIVEEYLIDLINQKIDDDNEKEDK